MSAPEHIVKAVDEARAAVQFERDDLVQVWSDDGMGGGWAYGIVESVAPKTMVVRWESALRQRLRLGRYDIRLISNPEIYAEMRSKFGGRG